MDSVTKYLVNVDANPQIVLLPASAMALFAGLRVFHLGYSRVSAIANRKVRMGIYKTDAPAGKKEGDAQKEGSVEPMYLSLLGENIVNLYETPQLFYAVCLAYFVQKGSADQATMVLAWLYVLLRVIHTYVHTGGNNVSYRFFAFGSSMLVLNLLWGRFAYSLIKSVQ